MVLINGQDLIRELRETAVQVHSGALMTCVDARLSNPSPEAFIRRPEEILLV
ncbi:hypothetical protein [Kitasatospora sp. NPDC051705]|uniref:hypothetical protein n=1 Tax=Kitasatospora sp. NPDC051705 TaxID=3364057 RepID=UPI0037AFF32E